MSPEKPIDQADLKSVIGGFGGLSPEAQKALGLYCKAYKRQMSWLDMLRAYPDALHERLWMVMERNLRLCGVQLRMAGLSAEVSALEKHVKSNPV